MNTAATLAAAIFGAAVGSFLNVCIYRLPLGKSVVWPGSACARCGECQVWCPVYAQDRRERITARGKLDSLRRLVEDALPEDEQNDFLEGLYECSACGQCHVVCPARINTPEMWEQARLSLVNAGIPQPEAAGVPALSAK